MDIRSALLILMLSQAINLPEANGLRIVIETSYDGRFRRQDTSYIQNDRRRREYRTEPV
jgi:hypothetical protein